MLPPGVESWTDTSNNEAWLAGQIGYTHNAFSVYAQSKRDNNPVYEQHRAAARADRPTTATAATAAASAAG